ncbi:DUF5406 family protein [Enterococcus faecium]|uniref:DUF5406 family protein n=1 Tax=Enterococcus faecium TaxID=1352 RepID=UPI0015E3D527|nr:DUF5406 family protein [Enterococcus faecium]
MKNYDPNSRWGTHTIKVSFQRWDYKGFVMFRKGGNCKGLSVLSLDEEDLYYQPLTDNPIGFGLLPEDDEGNRVFCIFNYRYNILFCYYGKLNVLDNGGKKWQNQF